MLTGVGATTIPVFGLDGSERGTKSMSDYLLDNAWAGALDRFALLESIYDPASIKRMNRIGIAEGWKCFVPGAGRASLAHWLSDRVGESGEVFATDIDTRLFPEQTSPNIRWTTHDITKDALEANYFDFAHVRLLLMHLRDPLQALQKIARALKPGGVVLLEEYDLFSASWCGHPEVALFWEKAAAAWGKASLQFSLGARLSAMAMECGLRCSWIEAHPCSFQGRSAEANFHRMTALQSKAKLVGPGLLTEEEFMATMNFFSTPTRVLSGPTIVALAAQKPE